jgi:hypothetical protein
MKKGEQNFQEIEGGGEERRWMIEERNDDKSIFALFNH